MELQGVEKIFEVLNSAGVRYLVVGGLAVNAHGYVRMTMDVDLVIGLEPRNILEGLRALGDAGFKPAIPVTPEKFADPANRERWREEKDMRVLKLWSDSSPLTPLDIFVYEPFDFDAEYAAAVHTSIKEGVDVPIVCLATLLSMKEAAGRPQDMADIDALNRVKESGDEATSPPK